MPAESRKSGAGGGPVTQGGVVRITTQEKVLREVVNKEIVHESLAQLITVKNLPHP